MLTLQVNPKIVLSIRFGKGGIGLCVSRKG